MQTAIFMKMLEGIIKGTKRTAKHIVDNSRKYATGLAVAGALFTSPQKANAAINGYTTWNTGYVIDGTTGVTNNLGHMAGVTNTIKSGDILLLNLVQGTQSNLYSDMIRFTLGTGNALTNNLQLAGSSYFNNSSGLVTNPNAFYYNKTLDLDTLVTYPVTNKGGYFEGRLSIGAANFASGTGDVMQLQFQALNNGPTDVLVPINLSSITVGRSGGTWGYPASWANKSLDYGDSAYAYINLTNIPEPTSLALVGLGIGLGAALLSKRLFRKKEKTVEEITDRCITSQISNWKRR